MKSLEYHVGGQPVRVIVEGVPSPQGRTQAQKAAWFARHADRYRRGLVLAPRGHADMSAVLLTEPSSAGAHAGLVFLDAAAARASRCRGDRRRDSRRGTRADLHGRWRRRRYAAALDTPAGW
jgi:proline racemase